MTPLRPHAALRRQDRPLALLLDVLMLLANVIGWGTVLIIWAAIWWGPRP